MAAPELAFRPDRRARQSDWPAAADDGERRVLVVDDDLDFAESLAEVLAVQGYKVEKAGSVPAGEAAVEAFQPQVVLLDIRLGQDNGVDLLRALKQSQPGLICLMITGYAALDSAAHCGVERTTTASSR